MTTHETLVAAKSHLMEHGWCQGALHRDDQVCVIGAINVAGWGSIELNEQQLGERRPLLGLLSEINEAMVCGSWNDAPERTFDDVIALLDRAILATAPAETPQPEKALA